MKLKDFILKLESIENKDLVVSMYDAEHCENYTLNPDAITVIGDSLVLGRGELKWYEKPWEDK